MRSASARHLISMCHQMIGSLMKVKGDADDTPLDGTSCFTLPCTAMMGSAKHRPDVIPYAVFASRPHHRTGNHA